MKEKDLLGLLQDIWEEDGMFNYLKIHYTENIDNNLNTLQEIIGKGLIHNFFDIYECVSTNKKLSIDDFRKLTQDKALKVTRNLESWTMEKNIYEVTFANKNKWFDYLFVDKKIPKEFSVF